MRGHPRMGRHPRERSVFSRRAFLRRLRWAPMAFLPAPLYAQAFQGAVPRDGRDARAGFPFTDYRITPHYPKKSPLDDVLRYVTPGTDQYKTEGYASEIGAILEAWSRELRVTPHGTAALAAALSETFQGAKLFPVSE